MNSADGGLAFGAPGIEPRWTRSTKEGIGTAYHSSCRVWFTLSHGIVNEIYYPNVDCPNTRDLQFLITDGESFCHEERRDLDYRLAHHEKGTLCYQITTTDPQARYQLIKDVIADPHASVLLMRTRVEIKDESLKSKLRVFALLAPHMKGIGQHNSGRVHDVDGRPLFHVHREGLHMVFGASPDFNRRSVGYVGYSDGWQDLTSNFQMDWEFGRAEDGNIALTAEIDGSRGWEFVLGVAFGRSAQSASTKLLQSLARPFEEHLTTFLKQWRRTLPAPATADAASETEANCWLKDHTGDGGRTYRLSRLVLLAHEDKIYPGAVVASMSIPWGETKSDADLGGYHLVWTRDLVKTASGLIASGQTATPLRSLIWLACTQEASGAVPQNSWIDGTPYWRGRQLDEVAAPILLAWRLRRANALGLFDPSTVVLRAARYLILHGPVTGQERWEENAGYSPSTLAWMIAGLVCAAEFAPGGPEGPTATFILEHADWLSAHLEDWTVTSRGELVPGKPRHFIRLTPAEPGDPGQTAEPDTASIRIANGGGLHPARNVVSGDFLELVRLGVRDALDPLIVDSVAVLDAVLKYDLPQGPGWRRYNHDGYGQKDDGSAFDGTGSGRCWPLLTGERGHYELAAGRDPLAFIRALEQFANEGGMLPEQVWDGEDIPAARMRRGYPTGSAMPLCWAHAEYLSLVRSRQDGVGFDLIPPVKERYASRSNGSRHEVWSFCHQVAQIPRGKILRVITAAPATLVWSGDEWQATHELETRDTGLGCWSADLETARCSPPARIVFTFRWRDKPEDRNFAVEIG
ncbi:MAG TPA: glycoside hydrolase family 15 protein [Verrucomicrobiae bacterium]